MNRRDFLKSALGVGLASIAGGGILGLLKQPEVPRIAKLPAHPEKLRLGWVVYEEVGMAVVNDYAISRIAVS